ncbi:MAG: hypothetical protein OXF93_11670 [Acidobacteria bacterium]|nr:hypothetical protein [Acidobacteriota bacterium]
MHARARVVVAAAALLCLGGLPVAQDAPQPWIHVEVVGGDEEGNVSVNLPLAAAEVLASMIPPERIGGGEIQLTDTGVSVSIPAVRKMWSQLMDAGDAEFITIEHEDDTVRVARSGDEIEVRMARGGEAETAEMRLPVAVVDALLSGDGDSLNLRAALDRLSELRGDIVRVREDDRRIRVWIDEVPQP